MAEGETCYLTFHLVFLLLTSCDCTYDLAALNQAEGERLKYLLILSHSVS